MQTFIILFCGFESKTRFEILVNKRYFFFWENIRICENVVSLHFLVYIIHTIFLYFLLTNSNNSYFSNTCYDCSRGSKLQCFLENNNNKYRKQILKFVCLNSFRTIHLKDNFIAKYYEKCIGNINIWKIVKTMISDIVPNKHYCKILNNKLLETNFKESDEML